MYLHLSGKDDLSHTDDYDICHEQISGTVRILQHEYYSQHNLLTLMKYSNKALMHYIKK
ncbi:hypothetical protein A359_07450 [secondary endosymbiont of Ctenarytaina eucalypti]|uniref:Uncharacterized protein n=1 Tax=secondary endosymbiont of Ctenarytaina eucalypti TaxID=1199245 RepID=J3TXV3_9ENTR|nr:hypothetical protein A359_07450 [secondary endosymbiont of Ctenarytaina eucalypti]